jgi:hypothetical protein
MFEDEHHLKGGRCVIPFPLFLLSLSLSFLFLISILFQIFPLPTPCHIPFEILLYFHGLIVLMFKLVPFIIFYFWSFFFLYPCHFFYFLIFSYLSLDVRG